MKGSRCSAVRSRARLERSLLLPIESQARDDSGIDHLSDGNIEALALARIASAVVAQMNLRIMQRKECSDV